MPIRLGPGAVTRVLFSAIGALLLLHLLMLVARFGFDHHRLLGLVVLFDMTLERNVPACFAALNMLLCAALMIVIAAVRQSQGDRSALGWAVLAAVFLLFTYDELFDVHHLVELPLHDFLHSNGVPRLLSFGPYAVIAAVAVVQLRLLAVLPAPTRRSIVVAGLVFVAGAFLIDGQSPHVAEALGVRLRFAELTTQTLEELVEMVGIALFTRALLLHMADTGIAIALVRDAPHQTAPAPLRAVDGAAR